MKHLIIPTIVMFGLLLFTSCEDSMGPTINSEPGVPVFTSHSGGESFVLNEAEAEEILMTLTWEAPDFGFSAAITYTVELSLSQTDFDQPVILAQTNQTTVELTVGHVNSRLLTAGLSPDNESPAYIRIRAHISDSVDDRFSEPVELRFTPFAVVIEIQEIYVPGGFQSASGYGNDWTPGDAPPLFSRNNDDRYEGYVYFNNDNSMYKFTAERSWDLNWGDDDADGTLQQNGADIDIGPAGYYRINVDLNNFTYSTLSTKWGVIGDATPDGWDADQDMEYDIGDKVWRLTLDLTEGELKFRANDDWALNFGDDGGDGTLQQDGANIPVPEAGNYTVILDLSGVEYTYSLIQN